MPAPKNCQPQSVRVVWPTEVLRSFWAVLGLLHSKARFVTRDAGEKLPVLCKSTGTHYYVLWWRAQLLFGTSYCRLMGTCL